MFKRIFIASCLLIFLISSLLFLCVTVSSGGITDKLKSVIARKNVAVGNGATCGGDAYCDPEGETNDSGDDECDSSACSVTNCWDCINDAVRTPSVPSDGLEIIHYGVASCTSVTHFLIEEATGPITTVRVHVYGRADSGGDDVCVDITDDGSNWEGMQCLSIGTVNTWDYHDFAVSWSGTTDFRVATCEGNNNSVSYVDAVYVELNP